MNKGISIALLVAGVLLIVFGISAADSVSSDAARLFTGAPSNKAIALLVAGVICALAGTGGLVRLGRAGRD